MKSLVIIALTLVSAIAVLPKGSFAYSNCAEAREKEAKRQNPYMDYQCDSDGNYLPLQGTKGQPHWYWCFDKDGGVLLGPSRNIRSCNCPLKKKEMFDAGRRFAGSCDSAGYFVVIQSNGTHHCCVDKETGEITVPYVPVSNRIDCH